MSFILRRLVFYVVAAWVALAVNFFIPRAMPGNAVEAIMAKFPSLQPSAYRALEAMLGVGHPGSIWHLYGAYLSTSPTSTSARTSPSTRPHPHRMGERPAEVYANLGRRILFAQVKDARRIPGDDWQLVLLGEGEVPVREMLGLLMADGYRQPISVEREKRWHPEIEAPEVALPQHLALLTQWLEEAR